MSAGAGGPRVQQLFDRAADAGDLRTVIFRGMGAILFAAGSAVASGVLTIADLLIIPASALANVAGEFVTAYFGGAAMIVQAAGLSTAQSVGPGGMFNIGPFTFALGVGAPLLGFYLIVAYLSSDATGNFVPGIPFDIPTPGFLGPEEEEE